MATFLKYFVIALVVVGLPVGQVFAAPVGKSVRETLRDKLFFAGGAATIQTATSLSMQVGNLISAVVGLAGVAALIIVIYAGILWIRAGGNDEKVSDATTLLKNGTIGLFIIIFAYAITQFVIVSLVAPSSATSQQNTTPPPPGTN